MQKLKKKLHQCGKPLEELSNRVFEELQLPVRSHQIIQYPIVVYANNDSISYLQFKNYKIAVNNNDNCVLLDNNSVAIILEIIQQNQILHIRAKHFINPTSFFTIPCDSKQLSIFLISSSTISNVIEIPVTRVKRKCVKIKCFNEIDSYVTIPLQHVCNEMI